MGYARDRLAVVIVQDIRDVPAEFEGALEADLMSSYAEIHERMAAGAW
ncbi:hypothetical protein [Streptomyces cyaneofuscatus]